MKMPNLASFHHCGCWYLISVAQSGRYGPSCACLSASPRRRLRSVSYFATDCCHSRSISPADLMSRVGASGSEFCPERWVAAAKTNRARQTANFFIRLHPKRRRFAPANAFIEEHRPVGGRESTRHQSRRVSAGSKSGGAKVG